MNGVTNDLDYLDALRDEYPDGSKGSYDIASQDELSFDGAFAPLALKVGHQVLQFSLSLCLVTHLRTEMQDFYDFFNMPTFLMSMALSNTPRSSMNSRVTPDDMLSPAIASIAVQCLSVPATESTKSLPRFQLRGS